MAKYPPILLDNPYQINHTEGMMRFLSRIFFRCVLLFLFVVGSLFSFSSPVSAQTPTPAPRAYTTSNLNDDVPRDQHTYVQSMLIEFMLAIQCQITGVDLARPGQSCLGLDITTGKLGYAPQEAYEQGLLPMHGLMGMLNNGISTMFVPIAGSHEYVRYVAKDFGLVKPALAATGFEGLSPVLGLWKASRDLAYFVLIVAFIFIGIGVMLRLHIDPRTVMTIQNQIPRVIIAIILITFSYAIAGLFIDVMWTVTYMGINKLTDTATDPSNNPRVGCSGDKLSSVATKKILNNPLSYADDVFMDPGCGTGGILDLSGKVGASMAVIQTDLLIDLFGLDCDYDVTWNPLTWGNIITDSISCAGALEINSLLKWFLALAWIIIALIIILISLFRIWFSLLKAYAMIFMYVVLGPLWIVMGLLPKKPLGFEKWIRILFANLAVFPATAFLFVFGRILTDRFSADTSNPLNPFAFDTTNFFVPPLIGDPATGRLGGLIAFAILLATPSILDTLREKLGVPPSKAFQGAVQAFNTGHRAPGALGKKAWQGAYRINPTTGAAESALAIGVNTMKGRAKRALLNRTGILGSGVDPDQKEPNWKKFLRESDERKENMRAGHGYVTNEDRYSRDPRANPNNTQRVKDVDDVLRTTDHTNRTAAQRTTVQGARDAGLLTQEQLAQLQREDIRTHAGTILTQAPAARSNADRRYLTDNEVHLTDQQRDQLETERRGVVPTRTTGTPGNAAGTPGGGTTGGGTTINITINNNAHASTVQAGETASQYLSRIIPDAGQRTPVLQAITQQITQAGHQVDTPLTTILQDTQQRTAFEATLSRHQSAINPSSLGNTGGPGTPGGPGPTTT